MVVPVERLCLAYGGIGLHRGFGREQQPCRVRVSVVQTDAQLQARLRLPPDAARHGINEPGRLVSDAPDGIDVIGRQGAELLHILNAGSAQGCHAQPQPVAVDALHIHPAQDAGQLLLAEASHRLRRGRLLQRLLGGDIGHVRIALLDERQDIPDLLFVTLERHRVRPPSIR